MTWWVHAVWLTTVAATPSAPVPPPQQPRVAVMEIRALDTPSKAQVELLQEVILTDLARTRRFEVVGKSDIQAMLGLERQKALLGCSDESNSCLAELGGALGADYVLLGTVARIDQTRRVDLKLLDTKRNRVVAREFASGNSDSEVLEKTRAALVQLASAIPGGAPLAPPPGPPLPWAGIATTAAGGVLAIGGGVVAGLTTSSYYAERSQLTFSQAQEREATKNVGLGVAALGLAVTGVGIWLLTTSSAPATSSVAVIPTREGFSISYAGVFP